MFDFLKGKTDQSAKAVAAIQEALADTTTKYDVAYIQGLTDMAFTLGAITMNERAEYATQAHAKERAEAAKGQPIYKKKGVYEYRDYLILKDFAREQVTNECWCVMDKERTEMFAKDVAFKEAARRIDELTEGAK